MYSLLYVSVATTPFSDEDLLSLLDVARNFNSEHAITGMLLFKEGNFMQVLEGEDRAVQALAGRIARDPRHGTVTTLLERSIAQREFADWSMGFRDLDTLSPASLPAYTDFSGLHLTASTFASQPTRAYRMLKAFSRS